MTIKEERECEVRFAQIVAAPFTTATGSTYSVLGLGTNGVVYRYDPKCEGWIEWPMTVATCRTEHKAKR
jgi:hypothetical protein